jgi:hypothetical protein
MFPIYIYSSLFFVNPIKQDLDMVIQIMKLCFGDATGLHINLEKIKARWHQFVARTLI